MINNSAAAALLSFVLLNLIFSPNFKKNFNIIAYLKPKIHICRHLINFIGGKTQWDL